MNWLTNYVRPKIRALYARKEVPDNLWHKCPSCESMLFHRELEDNLHVCQHCGFHMRLGPVKRLETMFDDGAYEGVELPKSVADPLKFRDQKRYTDRLKEAQTKTGRTDAIVVGEGRIGGHAAVVAAFDFGFMGGSMGIAVGEGLLTAARLAVAKNAPLIVVPASGGARMQEGILSLMQMPRTTIAVEMVKEAGLPYIVVLTDPTTGGVTASFAMLGDIHIAEKGAQIGFAGARVIESTIRETLPEGFQRSEYLLEHGMVDMVVHRRDLRPTLVRTIGLLMTPRIDAVVEDLDLTAAQGAVQGVGGEPAQLPQGAVAQPGTPQPGLPPATQATAAQPASTAEPVQAGDD
ncbi:acetyl-CoA carboxylase, carboxyltransferase subunit beta [Azospirillum sp. 11R-A]|uniref:acetyl-CoA carboxylase, carboxyltransferase subunit beta n=1 Tax=Azospirillum sp. 11R-A TaxID=3111634 RepID=UPI003C2A7841